MKTRWIQTRARWARLGRPGRVRRMCRGSEGAPAGPLAKPTPARRAWMGGWGAAAAGCLTLALGLLGAAEPALTPVEQPRPLLLELQRRMVSLKSVSLEFTQERHLQLFEQPLRSQGVMFIQPPNRIRWEMTEPYQSILLGDARSVAQFEKGEQGWNKLNVGFPGPLRQVMTQMVLMQRGDLEALEKDYTLSLATGEVAVLTMVPRDETVRSFLESLEVWFELDFTATREVWMREPGGDATRMIIRRERRDVTFPEGTFDQARPLDLALIRSAMAKHRLSPAGCHGGSFGLAGSGVTATGFPLEALLLLLRCAHPPLNAPCRGGLPGKSGLTIHPPFSI